MSGGGTGLISGGGLSMGSGGRGKSGRDGCSIMVKNPASLKPSKTTSHRRPPEVVPTGSAPVEFIKRLRVIPANTSALRAERKRISREVAPWDRMAILDMAHELIEARIP